MKQQHPEGESRQVPARRILSPARLDAERTSNRGVQGSAVGVDDVDVLPG